MSVPKKTYPSARVTYPYNPLFFMCIMLSVFVQVSCTFDYGEQETFDGIIPDIVMEDVEYVRFKAAEPVARIYADRLERYEGRQLMELSVFSFEQFVQNGEEINAFGKADNASIEIDTGNVRMAGDVRIEMESEDMAIETNELTWNDRDRLLSAAEDDEVSIYQGDGTSITGVGFQADARRRSWEFTGGASGTYGFSDEEN